MNGSWPGIQSLPALDNVERHATASSGGEGQMTGAKLKV